MALKTNYKDDVLDTSKNTKRKYNMITNPDGTVSFEDVTEYTTEGSTFGAGDINQVTTLVNGLSANGSITNVVVSTSEPSTKVAGTLYIVTEE